MNVRDRIVEAALLGITGGAIGAALAILWRSGVQAEPFFALVGALIGTAGTVAGAVWVNDRNTLADHRAETRILVQEYDGLLKQAHIAQAAAPKNEPAWPPGFRPALHEVERVCQKAAAVSAEALQSARTLNFQQRAQIRRLAYAIESFSRFHNDAFGERELDPMDERTWDAELDYLITTTTEALTTLSNNKVAEVLALGGPA